ncbi:MAG: glutathione S-transferase family protein [Bacteriovoracia bacterium]
MTQRSPFARRVRMAMLRNQIAHELTNVEPFKPSEEFLQANPLGLVPVLILPNGDQIADSAAILEFLNETHGGIWPVDPQARYRSRQLSTLAEGLTLCAVLHFQETMKESTSRTWQDRQREKIERTLRVLEREHANPLFYQANGAELAQPGLDLGAALEYLEFRLPDFKWREHAPKLTSLYDKFTRTPGYSETRPSV